MFPSSNCHVNTAIDVFSIDRAVFAVKQLHCNPAEHFDDIIAAGGAVGLVHRNGMSVQAELRTIPGLPRLGQNDILGQIVPA